jgi:hypothetical protein
VDEIDEEPPYVIVPVASTPQSSDVAGNVRNWLAFRGGFTL